MQNLNQAKCRLNAFTHISFQTVQAALVLVELFLEATLTVSMHNEVMLLAESVRVVDTFTARLVCDAALKFDSLFLSLDLRKQQKLIKDTTDHRLQSCVYCGNMSLSFLFRSREEDKRTEPDQISPGATTQALRLSSAVFIESGAEIRCAELMEGRVTTFHVKT